MIRWSNDITTLFMCLPCFHVLKKAAWVRLTMLGDEDCGNVENRKVVYAHPHADLCSINTVRLDNQKSRYAPRGWHTAFSCGGFQREQSPRPSSYLRLFRLDCSLAKTGWTIDSGLHYLSSKIKVFTR